MGAVTFVGDAVAVGELRPRITTVHDILCNVLSNCRDNNSSILLRALYRPQRQRKSDRRVYEATWKKIGLNAAAQNVILCRS